MKKVTILLLLLSQIVISQTREVKGTVIDETKTPLPGANIKIKGTSTRTVSNFDGEFIIKVPDSLHTIEISYLGFVTKEIDVSTILDTNGIITLSEDLTQLTEVITVCRWYPQHIGINYYGGLNNSGLGFLMEYYDPYPLKLPIVPELKLGYQTNSKNNTQTLLEFNLKDIIRVFRKNFDIDFSYNKIAFNNNFQWKSYKAVIETEFNTFRLRSSSFSLGLGKSTLNSKDHIGITGGFKQYLFKGIRVNSEITNWEGLWQIQPGISCSHKGFRVFYKFNSIDNYSEHNIGIGYLINF